MRMVASTLEHEDNSLHDLEKCLSLNTAMIFGRHADFTAHDDRILSICFKIVALHAMHGHIISFDHVFLTFIVKRQAPESVTRPVRRPSASPFSTGPGSAPNRFEVTAWRLLSFCVAGADRTG